MFKPLNALVIKVLDRYQLLTSFNGKTKLRFTSTCYCRCHLHVDRDCPQWQSRLHVCFRNSKVARRTFFHQSHLTYSAFNNAFHVSNQWLQQWQYCRMVDVNKKYFIAIIYAERWVWRRCCFNHYKGNSTVVFVSRSYTQDAIIFWDLPDRMIQDFHHSHLVHYGTGP